LSHSVADDSSSVVDNSITPLFVALPQRRRSLWQCLQFSEACGGAPGYDFLSSTTHRSHGSRARYCASSFLDKKDDAPAAKGPPGTVQGYPDHDQEKDEWGLKPGECHAQVLEAKQKAALPKDMRDADAKREEDAVDDRGRPVKVHGQDGETTCALDSAKKEKMRPRYPDPPIDPKKVYAADKNGPVGHHASIPGGAARVMQELRVGRKVEVQGLMSDEGRNLNGQTGRIMSGDEVTEAFVVQTEDGEEAKVPAVNLTPVDPDPEADAEAERIAAEAGPRGTDIKSGE